MYICLHDVPMDWRYCGRKTALDSALEITDGAWEKNNPPEKKTLWKKGSQSTKSGAERQLLALDCRAKACVKGVSVFRDAGVSSKSPLARALLSG